jgi:hypothetical protein
VESYLDLEMELEDGLFEVKVLLLREGKGISI